MISFLTISDKKIRVSDQGKGDVIVLLHGYLESLDIWTDFAEELSKNFRVISIDIPGHGESEIINPNQSMIVIANAIKSTLVELKVASCFMIGHSMGGYVILMFQKLYPEMLWASCLFHSHPFADTEETKKKRLREIKLVEEGKKELIAKVNIPNAFADDNLISFKTEIEKSIQIAYKTPEEGIIANLHAMMNRPGFSEFVSESETPFLLIAGKKDNYIDFENLIPKINMPTKGVLSILENSGHMGFIEEKEESLKIINQFINTI